MTATTEDLWHRLECPCNPGFKYKNYLTMAHHFGSQRHVNHELRINFRQLKIQNGILENQKTRNIFEKNRLLDEKFVLVNNIRTLNERLSNTTNQVVGLSETLENLKLQRRIDAKRLICLWILKMREKHRNHEIQCESIKIIFQLLAYFSLI